jgi:hypothetical protein
MHSAHQTGCLSLCKSARREPPKRAVVAQGFKIRVSTLELRRQWLRNSYSGPQCKRVND